MTIYNIIEYLYISDSFLKQLWFVSRLKIQLNLHVQPLLVSYHLQYVTTNPKHQIFPVEALPPLMSHNNHFAGSFKIFDAF